MATTPGTNTDTKAQPEEVLLRDRLRRIAEAPSGWFTVHLHLSELRPANKKPRYLRIAARSFESIVANSESTLFILGNADLVLVCRDVPIDEVDAAVGKVRSLFSEDPLAMAAEGSLEDHFSTWYDLSETNDLNQILAHSTRLAIEAAKAPKRADQEGGNVAASVMMTGDQLEPSNLAEINQKLERSKITDLVRRQTAIQVDPGGRGTVLFREHYVSMLHLQKRVAPGVNLFANTWLFQYLTETLDRSLLMIVAKHNLTDGANDISLNLNISTVLSREFQQFHRAVSSNAHKIVVELQMLDVIADISAYFVARDMLREGGYRVLVDGVSPVHLQYFDPSILGPDYLKITWSRDFLTEAETGYLGGIRDGVRNTGPERIILARVDSQEAISWGLTLSVRRFQGHFADRIVEAMFSKGVL